jgi:hypothetical protein
VSRPNAERGVVIIRMPKARTLNEWEKQERCRYEAIGDGWAKRISAGMVKELRWVALARIGNTDYDTTLVDYLRDANYHALIDEHGITARGRGVLKAWDRFKSRERKP